MSGIQLTVYVLVAFGLWYIVGASLITRNVREWAFDFDLGGHTPPFNVLRPLILLVECPACFGFWTGLGAFIAGTEVISLSHWLPTLAINLFFTTATNLCLGKALGLMPPE